MTPNDDILAKKRYFAIVAIRLAGAMLVLIGFVLIRGGWELAGQPTDRWIGVALDQRAAGTSHPGARCR